MSTWADLVSRIHDDARYDLDLPSGSSGGSSGGGDGRILRELARQGDLAARHAETFALVPATFAAGFSEFALQGPAFARRVHRPIALTVDGAAWGIVTSGRPSHLGPTFRRAYHAPTADGVGVLLFDGQVSASQATRAWAVEALVLPSAPITGGGNATWLSAELEDVVADLALCDLARRYATEAPQISRLVAIEGAARERIREARARSRRDRYAPGLLSTSSGTRTVAR